MSTYAKAGPSSAGPARSWRIAGALLLNAALVALPAAAGLAATSPVTLAAIGAATLGVALLADRLGARHRRHDWARLGDTTLVSLAVVAFGSPALAVLY